MAKIGKIAVTLKKYPEYFDLYYTQKKRFEIVGLPEELIALTKFCTYGYSTESQLSEKVFETVRKYRELIMTEKKVIIYRIAASNAIKMNKEGEGRYVGTRANISEQIKSFKQSFDIEEYSIGVTYGIYKEVFDGANTYYRIREDGTTGSKHNLSGEFVIDYTEEREAFFKSIYDGIDKLAMLISNFFNGDIAQIAAKIDEARRNSFLLNAKN